MGGDDGGGIDNTDEIEGQYSDPGQGGVFAALPLVNDMFDPQTTVFREHADTVTGIYVESADKVLVVTQGANSSAQSGGAVFKATSTAVMSVAFSDARTLQPSFVGLERTPAGYIAMTAANALITSANGGTTFTSEAHGQASAMSTKFGGEAALAFRLSSRGITHVRDNGIVSTSADVMPAASTIYTNIWAPEGSTSPARPGYCVHGPHSAGARKTRYSVYVSSDASFIAYTSTNAGDHPEVCISTDGGHGFRGYALEVPDAVASRAPTGVAFATRKTGIAWFASGSAGAYIRRTINGGSTWKPVALPSEIASHDLEFPAGFFASDGNTGWLVGYDHSANAAVVLRTFDRGATWAVVSGIPEAVTAGLGGKLYSGFAVDATHIWLGGDLGLVMHN